MTRSATARSALVLALCMASTVYADPPALWDETPYRVAIRLRVEGPQVSAGAFRSNLQRSLQARIATRIRSLWITNIDVTQQDLGGQPVSDDFVASHDKLIVVSVTENGAIRVSAREYDTTVSRWGKAVQRLVVDHGLLAEGLTAAIVDAFRPLAAFDLNTDDTSVVSLAFRGAALLPDSPLTTANDAAVLLPYPLRLDRQGNPVRELSKPTPWTYLIRETALDAETDGPSARVVSSKRLPFGARRRGRVEQLALVLKTDQQSPTTLRVIDQDDTSAGLRGYEVFTTPLGEKQPLTRIGRTDTRGEALLPGDRGAVRAHVKCGAAVVASLPIVPGAEAVVTVPLLNETARLQAETRLNQLQEELVDVSAQRTILVQRVRSQLEAGRQERAEALLRDIDKLPGRAQFSQQLNRLAELYRADHPVSQKRLERLYSTTRKAIASAFDLAELRDLESEVISARAGGA